MFLFCLFFIFLDCNKEKVNFIAKVTIKDFKVFLQNNESHLWLIEKCTTDEKSEFLLGSGQHITLNRINLIIWEF